MYPKEFRYTNDHEWILVEDGTGTVGITDHAQDELGDVVYVELPEVGTKLEAGAVMGTIESVKAVADLFAPVSGEVTAVNEALEDEPELVNSSPHEAGWMVKLALSDPGELEKLMTAEAYEEYLQESDH